MDEQYRQGDILLTKTPEPLDEDAKQRSTNVILQGMATGHAHRIENGEVYDQWGGIFVKVLPGGGRLVHEEHNPIPLPEGIYQVTRQRQIGDEYVAD